MFCSKCGTQNEDSSNFCTKCSQPLNQAAAAPQPDQPQPQQPPQSFPHDQSQWPNQPNLPNQPFQQGQPNQPFQQGQSNQAFQQIPQGQQPQQWQQPLPSSGQARAAKKSNPALVILIVVICLVVAFFVWAALSPDTVPAEAGAAMESPGEAAAESPEEAVTLVRALVGIDNLVFNHEEAIIKGEDGTYSIDVNTPELANVASYVVGPPENGETMFELYDYFFVVKGTDLVLRMNPANDLMEQVTGPIPEERASVEPEPEPEPEASVAVESKESEKTDTVMDADATLAFLKKKTGDKSLEFLREENFIGNSDGSLAIDIDAESGSEACYLFAPANFEDVAGYVGYYAVRMGTKKVYVATMEDPGTLYEMP